MRLDLFLPLITEVRESFAALRFLSGIGDNLITENSTEKIQKVGPYVYKETTEGFKNRTIISLLFSELKVFEVIYSEENVISWRLDVALFSQLELDIDKIKAGVEPVAVLDNDK
jgi:hypothetical protein